MTNGEIDLAVVRRVTRDDAAWFRAHPAEQVRYRPYVDGETDTSWLDTPPVPPNGTLELLVEVERMGERTRRRTFCWTVRVDPNAHHNFMSTVDEDDDVDDPDNIDDDRAGAPEPVALTGTARAETDVELELDLDFDDDDSDDVLWDFVRRRARRYIDEHDGGSETEMLRAITEALGPIVEALAFYGDPATYAIAARGDDEDGPFFDDLSSDHGDPAFERPMPGARAREAVQMLFDDDEALHSSSATSGG